MTNCACNNSHTLVGRSCRSIDYLHSVSALPYVTGCRYFEYGLSPEKTSQKRNHGWGPIGEVRIFNVVTFLLKVRSNCLSNEKQVIKREKNDNMKQQEKSGYRCYYFDKNRQERYQQKKKYFISKKRSRVVVLNSNAHRNHRGCLFKVQRLSLWVVLC